MLNYKPSVEDQILVKKLARADLDLLKLNDSSNQEPVLYPIEEIVLEATDKTSKNNYSRLFIQRRSSDGVYFCRLSLKLPEPINKNQSDTSSNNTDVSSKTDAMFILGQANDVEKYEFQF